MNQAMLTDRVLGLVPYAVSMALSLAAGVITYRRRQVPGRQAYLAMVTGQVVYTALYAVELLAPGLTAKLVLDGAQYLPSALFTAAMPLLTQQYTGRQVLPPPMIRGVGLGVALLALPLMVAPWTGVFRESARLIDQPPFQILLYPFEWPDYLITAVVWVMTLVAAWPCLLELGARPAPYRGQLVALLVAMWTPIAVGTVVSFAGWRPLDQRDVIPLTFGVTDIVVLWALTRGQLFDLVPVAYQTVIEGLPDAVVVVDDLGRVAELNPAARRLLGDPRQALVGQPFDRLGERFPSLLALRAQAGRAGELAIDDRFHEALWAPLPRPGGGQQGEVLVLRDVTQQREAARQLRSANAELEAFNYTVAHDLRAPLRHIEGFGELLQEDAGASLNEAGRKHLARVREAARRMAVLIDDLLRLAGVGSQELDRQALSGPQVRALIEEVRDGLRPPGGATAPVDIAGDVDTVGACRADPGLLRQVFQNLLGNALKYSRGRDHARVQVGCQRAGGELIWSVQDQGVGFDMKDADKLFMVFQRLHAPGEFEGSGAGLAITRRIVERHGGRIWARGEVGRGATFWFTLGRPS